MSLSTAEIPWFDTLTITERAALAGPAAAGDLSESDRDLEARWSQLPPFQDPKVFEQRLASEDLDISRLRAAIGLRPEAAPAEPPAWVGELNRVLESGHREHDIDVHDADRAFDSVRFLPLVEPLVHDAVVRLRSRIQAEIADSPIAHFDADRIAKLLVPTLPGRLVMLIRRVLILELNIARLEGVLVGETPEDRFEDFIGRIGGAEEQRRIFAEYPVLARQISVRIDQWVEAGWELVSHIRQDWTQLGKQFGTGGGLGDLVTAKASLGDSHRGGRTVVRVGFDSGVEVIYKPRSMASEVCFNDLLRWLNDAGFEPGFRTLAVLDRGDHGWVEKVEIGPCQSPDQVERFYRRHGALCALLYVLNANDIHYENILAAGEYPMLIDMETLFLPRITAMTAGTDLTFMERMKRSALTSGLLPNPSRLSSGEGVSDLSGMADIAGQKTWAPMLVAVDQGTDSMRFDRRFQDISGGENTTSVEGERVLACHHTDAILEGFATIYRLMVAHRDGLLAADGPIAAFADAEMRLVFRPTRVYASLLFESFHPDVLRDARERDMLFDHLWWAFADGPFMAPLLRSERQDLLNVDVPIFTADAGSTTIHDSRGRAVQGVIAESGLTVVRQIIEGLDEGDLRRQLWLVRGSMATMDLATAGIEARELLHLERDLAPPSPSRLLAAADRVAEELSQLAYEDQHRAGWYAFEYLEHPHWSLRYADAGVYEGLCGIAYFLAHHGAVRNDERSTQLARRAIDNLLFSLDSSREQTASVGAFAGQGGWIFTLCHLATLWEDPSLLDHAEAMVPGLLPLIEADTTYDLVGGSAGCLVALLELAALRPSREVFDAARACGDHLVRAAAPQDVGVGWPLAAAGGAALLGFSHGTAGTAWALLRLHALVGDARYRETALAALAYERSLYDAERGNWPDLRSGERPEEIDGRACAEDHHFLVAWCHGAPGILLSRLLSAPLLDGGAADGELRDEIEAALATTLKDGFETGHCLCHGALGNLDILLVAAEALERPELAENARRLARGVLDHQAEKGWHYGVPGKLTPPGLMVGLAGFGFQMLRLAAPARVPSILALESPRSVA
ncbi:MAG: type 2 lanthipeptide synthetase LanM family protein [Acidobacteriota bacterium]